MSDKSNPKFKPSRFASISFLISALAFAVSLTAFLLFFVLTGEADFKQSEQLADSAPIRDHVISFVAQTIVFVLGGTLSLVGATLSALGLKDKNRPSGWLSLALAILGPAVLIVGPNFI